MHRILIVDDEATDLLLMQAALARAGYQTVTASAGEEALRTFLDGGVDLVVTDLQMEDVHGFELISILREFTPPPPVVAVSGTGPFQLHMAESLGARWTLLKPIDPHLLIETVKQALSGVDAEDDTLLSG